MTLDEFKAARPLAFALTVGGAGVIVWMLFHTTVSIPTVSEPIPSDPEVRLCDEQVPILLHSRDMIDLLRAEFIVQHVHCDIGKRL